MAKANDNHSTHDQHPFVGISCAAMLDTLFESELVEYKNGTFTGAERYEPGRITQRDYGSRLLDEIADLGRPPQAKLLRLLQERATSSSVHTIPLGQPVAASSPRTGTLLPGSAPPDASAGSPPRASAPRPCSGPQSLMPRRSGRRAKPHSPLGQESPINGAPLARRPATESPIVPEEILRYLNGLARSDHMV